MDDSKIWHLHGGRYDLSSFLDDHPGGKSILVATRGLRDATPLFESYHAFANRQYIQQKLETFRVPGPGLEPLYRYDGFYQTFVARARAHFGATHSKGNESVTARVKASTWWWMKIVIEIICMSAVWMITFVWPLSHKPEMRFSMGFLAGCLFISLGFNLMHDASHFAILPRNHWSNQLFLRVWTAWALWSGSYWMTHHVIRHHAFTGHADLDPDVQHARPFIRKSLETNRLQYLKMPSQLNQIWQFALMAASVFAVLPGMFVGQVLSYSIIWPWRGHLWKMSHPSKGSFDRTKMEIFLAMLSFASHFAFAPSLYASLGYLFGCNLAYSICILPDHDTFESAVENHKALSGEQLMDWGEIQVRHSSDFGIGLWGRLFGELAGGINYQVVHHLLPGVSHVHFQELTEIVKETCEEFNIPYTRHPSLASALWSVAKTFTVTMQNVNNNDHLPPSSMILKEYLQQTMIIDESNRHPPGMDLVTGALFGAWTSLLAIVIAKYGFHFLIILLSLVVSLIIYYAMGAFGSSRLDEKPKETRQRRLGTLYRASISIHGLLLGISILFYQKFMTHDIVDMFLMGETGIIAAELFALVLGETFKLDAKRVWGDTIKLVVFTLLVPRAQEPNKVALVLLTVEHVLGLFVSVGSNFGRQKTKRAKVVFIQLVRLIQFGLTFIAFYETSSRIGTAFAGLGSSSTMTLPLSCVPGLIYI